MSINRGTNYIFSETAAELLWELRFCDEGMEDFVNSGVAGIENTADC